MSLEALKQEVAGLDEKARKELMAYLVSLREEHWAAHAREISKRLDDRDPSRWLTLEEFTARLEKLAEPDAPTK